METILFCSYVHLRPSNSMVRRLPAAMGSPSTSWGRVGSKVKVISRVW